MTGAPAPLSILNHSRMSRRSFLGCLAAGALLSSCSSSHKTLNFYNWANYIGETTVPDFQKATGIRVNQDTFSSQDVLFAKLKIGLEGYDLVVATDYMVRRLIKHQLLAPMRGVQGLEGLLPRFQHKPWDPEHRFSVPYLWGTTGVAFNSNYARPVPDSLNVLWEPRYKNRIGMLNEKRDTIGAALLMLGLDGNSVRPEDLERAQAALLEQKPLVRKYSTDMIDDLVRQEFHVALGYSGDVGQAHDSLPELDYVIPREGGYLWADNLCIPHDAPHYEAAIAFVNFVLEPEVAAAITNTVGYPNAVARARELVDPKLLDNPLGYAPEAMLEQTVFQEDLGPGERLWDRVWEKVKLHST